jgi:putative hydrolase of the HAD superfamily
MATKAIIFDLDDTLVVEEASAEAAFLATCERARERYALDPRALHRSVRQRARELWHQSPARAYCVAVGVSSWEGLWARYAGDDPNLKGLREWAPTYRHESWARALVDHGVHDPALTDELAAAFPAERRTRHVVYPDVEPVLQELQETYRMGLITNGASDLQREKLNGAGLAHYFEVVIVAGDVGFGKPDPRIFGLALDRLGVPHGETASVGDSLKRDVLGAQQAGIQGIWINRNGREPEEGITPDAWITTLSELHDVL